MNDIEIIKAFDNVSSDDVNHFFIKFTEQKVMSFIRYDDVKQIVLQKKDDEFINIHAITDRILNTVFEQHKDELYELFFAFIKHRTYIKVRDFVRRVIEKEFSPYLP